MTAAQTRRSRDHASPQSVLDLDDELQRDRQKRKEFVNHYSFHIMHPTVGACDDQDQRPPPFARLILNGHEYVACTARAAGIGFTKERNCLTRVRERLAQIADTVSQPRTTGRLRRAQTARQTARHQTRPTRATTRPATPRAPSPRYSPSATRSSPPPPESAHHDEAAHRGNWTKIDRDYETLRLRGE